VSTARGATVLQVLPALNDGGVEQSAVEMALYLKARKWRPLVASAGGHKLHTLEQAGIPHTLVPLTRKGPASLLINAGRLLWIIKKEGVELVHARSRGPAWSAWLACRLSGVPLVTTFHGTYGLKGGLLKRFYNSVMLRAPVVVANSQFIRQHIIDIYGFNPDNIVVAPRGVDLEVFDPAIFGKYSKNDMRKELGIQTDAPLIAMVGRITRWKGHELLLHALAEVTDLPWALVVVGGAGKKKRDRDYVHSLYQLAAHLNLSERITWLGSRGDISRVLAACDLAVSPSIRPEAFGRVAIEAMAMEVPVVATGIGGSSETIIDGETGWLVPPGAHPTNPAFGEFTPQAMAEKLREALRNPRRVLTMGKAARKHVLAHYTVDQCCAQEMAAYQRVLAP
jgi:glycosyltransferase involved in cell wall biosynthesis